MGRDRLMGMMMMFRFGTGRIAEREYIVMALMTGCRIPFPIFPRGLGEMPYREDKDLRDVDQRSNKYNRSLHHRASIRVLR